MLAVQLSEWPQASVVWAIAVALIVCTAILGRQWRKVRQAEIEAHLKHDMLERCMSAEEIERVIRASRDDKDAAEDELPDLRGSRASGDGGKRPV